MIQNNTSPPILRHLKLFSLLYSHIVTFQPAAKQILAWKPVILMQIGKIYCILIMIFIVITFSLLFSSSQSFIPLIIHVEMFFWQLKYSTFMQCFDEVHQRK